MSRLRHVAADLWFELLVAVLALAGMLELVVGRDSPGAPTSRLWLSIPAVALLVLPLFARRRFPFAAPVAYWLVAAALAFVDGLLIPFGSLGVVGLATAFGLLVAERREVARLSRLEGLDAWIPGSVEGELAALGEPAQELPARDLRPLAQDRVHVEKPIGRARLRHPDEFLDRSLRHRVEAQRRPL